jgi:hypothetical protein
LLLRPLVGEQSRAGTFGRTTIFAPKIQVIGSRACELALGKFVGGNWSELGTLLAGDVAAGTERRKLIGAGDAELRLRLQHASGGDTNVIVVLQRDLD